MSYKQEIVQLEDDTFITLSYHPSAMYPYPAMWFVDVQEYVDIRGYSYLTKQDLEVLLAKINELENKGD